MLKFVHLTDLHLTNAREDCQGYDTFAATERALAHAARVHGDMAFLVITGDLANWGEIEAYERLKSLVDSYPHPVYLMIGNHDSRAHFLKVFGDRHPFEAPYAQFHEDRDGFRLLFVDSQTPGTHGGAFSRDRLDWIDAKLTASPHPVLLFMHHHPTAIGAPSMDAKGLRNWPAFHRILARHRDRLRHIFHGHCHSSLQGNIEGVSFSGLRSLGPQAYTDLKIERACRWYGEPHYAVALVNGNSVVTHQIEFNYAGPFLVRDRQNFDEFISHCAARGVTVPRQDPSPAEVP